MSTKSWMGGHVRSAAQLSAALALFGLLIGATGTAAAHASSPVGARADGVIEVPAEAPSIQEAVDAAEPGDLILIGAGVYNEAVDVTTSDVTIRGLERGGVVLDGEFELANGIRVLGASGVVIENLTVQNYSTNGIF